MLASAFDCGCKRHRTSYLVVMPLLASMLRRGVPALRRAASFHTAASRAVMGKHDAEFEKAKSRLNTLGSEPDNDVKLQMYGLFKQATTGKCNTKKPGVMDFVGKAKWDAWNSLGDMSQDAAQLKYIELINKLAGSAAATQQAASTAAASAASAYQTIRVEKSSGLCKIVLNRPTKKNAINNQMYNEWIQALKEADGDDSVTIAAVTGEGDYYSSGNDLQNFMTGDMGDIPAKARDGRELLRRFVGTFIDFKKPLVAVVNGPAVGVSVTVLALFDLVYATDRATFHTPFSSLGQSPEGCSSYLFPKLMGHAKATEMLLFNKKVTAHEAFQNSLVTEVFPDASFKTEVWQRLASYAALPRGSLCYSKQLMRDADRDALHKVNDAECVRLEERWQSTDCANSIMAFMSRKAKM